LYGITSGVARITALNCRILCVAIERIIQHVSFNTGITVESSTFPDLVYADDTASCFFRWPRMLSCTSLKSFDVILLHIYRTQSVLAKDKNYGTLVQALDHQIFQWTVILSNQSTAWFTSLQSSDGPCRPDLTRRIGHACAVMTSLKRIWSDN